MVKEEYEKCVRDINVFRRAISMARRCFGGRFAGGLYGYDYLNRISHGASTLGARARARREYRASNSIGVMQCDFLRRISRLEKRGSDDRLMPHGESR